MSWPSRCPAPAASRARGCRLSPRAGTALASVGRAVRCAAIEGDHLALASSPQAARRPGDQASAPVARPGASRQRSVRHGAARPKLNRDRRAARRGPHGRSQGCDRYRTSRIVRCGRPARPKVVSLKLNSCLVSESLKTAQNTNAFCALSQLTRKVPPADVRSNDLYFIYSYQYIEADPPSLHAGVTLRFL